MKLLAIFSLLINLTQSIRTDDILLVIDESSFSLDHVVFFGQHDIINVLTPLEALHHISDDKHTPVFFTQANFTKGLNDKNESVIFTNYKGVYLQHNGKVEKILENGRDSAGSLLSDPVYIGASDGLYIYNYQEKIVKKWGNITDSIINVVKVSGSDELYILTDEHQVYKVTGGGTIKTKVEEISYAQQIMLDIENALYYVDSEKNIFGIKDGIKEFIQGLPKSSNITLVKPPQYINRKIGIPVVLDGHVYIVDSYGISFYVGIDFKVELTSYSPEAFLIQFYGYDKKLYKINIVKELRRRVSSALNLKNRSGLLELKVLGELLFILFED